MDGEYNTYDELNYLKKIGTFAVIQKSRLPMLKKYRKVSERKTYPKNVDYAIIRAYVDDEIKRMEGK